MNDSDAARGGGLGVMMRTFKRASARLAQGPCEVVITRKRLFCFSSVLHTVFDLAVTSICLDFVSKGQNVVEDGPDQRPQHSCSWSLCHELGISEAFASAQFKHASG